MSDPMMLYPLLGSGHVKRSRSLIRLESSQSIFPFRCRFWYSYLVQRSFCNIIHRAVHLQVVKGNGLGSIALITSAFNSNVITPARTFSFVSFLAFPSCMRPGQPGCTASCSRRPGRGKSQESNTTSAASLPRAFQHLHRECGCIRLCL